MSQKPKYRVTTNGHAFRVEVRVSVLGFTIWEPIDKQRYSTAEWAIEKAKDEQHHFDTRTFTKKNTRQVWP